MVDLGYSSKLNAEWEFLRMLRDEGRRSAAAFLAAHGQDLGRRSSLDLDLLLEGCERQEPSWAKPGIGPLKHHAG